MIPKRLRSMLTPLFPVYDAPPTLVPPEYIEILCKLASQALDAPGDLMEVGVYKGGSLYQTAEYLRNHNRRQLRGRRFFGVDTFAGHPYHDPEHDHKEHFTGRFSDTSYEAVCRSLKPFRFVKLLKGECDDVFRKMPQGQRFCYAHIDVDIEKSAIRCTEYLYPRLTPGGILVYDEYRGFPQESYLTEFFKNKPVKLEERTGRPGDDYGLIVYRQK